MRKMRAGMPHITQRSRAGRDEVKFSGSRSLQDEGLGAGRRIGEAADCLLVDFDTESRSLRDVDAAVACLDRMREERDLELAGRKLDGQLAAEAGSNVERGRETRPEVEGVRRDGDVRRLSKGDDLLEFRDPADLRDARLQDVAGVPLHDLAKAVERRLVLAERD